MLKSMLIVPALLALSMPALARADPLDFSFQAATSAASNFNFQLDSSPTPDFTDGIETIFELSGTEDGVPASYEVRFYNNNVSGGVSVDYPANQNLNFTGPQIYGGTETNPTFTSGTYALFYAPNYNDPNFDPFAPSVFAGNLNVSAISAVSAAPEPETWALMFAGVAMLGIMLRFGRRRQGAALVA